MLFPWAVAIFWSFKHTSLNLHFNYNQKTLVNLILICFLNNFKRCFKVYRNQKVSKSKAECTIIPINSCRESQQWYLKTHFANNSNISTTEFINKILSDCACKCDIRIYHTTLKNDPVAHCGPELENLMRTIIFHFPLGLDTEVSHDLCGHFPLDESE